MPKLDEEFLAAGGVKRFASEASWARGIKILSAWAANGVPVAEYSLGIILLSLKRFWLFTRAMRTP